MKPCIIGCGAMGMLLALQLYRATGRPPLCVARRPEQARLINREGLTIRENGRALSVPAAAYSGEAPPGTCTDALIAVKSWSLPGALHAAQRSGARRVYMLLNGLTGEDEAVSAGYTPRFIVSTYGSRRTGPTSASVTPGEHIIGSPTGLDPWSCRLALLLRAGGARAWCTGNVQYHRWLKAAVNAAINGVATLLRAPNRVILENPWAARAARSAAEEAGLAARLAGVPLSPGEAWRATARVAEETGDNLNSTLQDLLACRRTEADAVYAPILRAAPGKELKTVETLYSLVKALEEGGLLCRGRRSQPSA